MERDFRTLKTERLEIRPVFVRKKGRPRGHAVVSLRALERRVAPLELTVEDAVELFKNVRLTSLLFRGVARRGALRSAGRLPAGETAAYHAALPADLGDVAGSVRRGCFRRRGGRRNREATGVWLVPGARVRHQTGMLYVYAALIGLLSGTTSGLFGVGGGIVMVPAMMFLLKLDIKMAVGTSLAVMVPSALMGASKHYAMGHVNWKVALAIIPVAIAMSFVGAWLTKYIPSDALKRGFGGLLLLVGAQLILGK